MDQTAMYSNSMTALAKGAMFHWMLDVKCLATELPLELLSRFWTEQSQKLPQLQRHVRTVKLEAFMTVFQGTLCLCWYGFCHIFFISPIRIEFMVPNQGSLIRIHAHWCDFAILPLLHVLCQKLFWLQYLTSCWETMVVSLVRMMTWSTIVEL